MPFKVKSEQISTEMYSYTLADGINQLFFAKARRNEVLIIHKISIFNTADANTGACYKVMKRRGVIYYLNSTAAITASLVQRWGIDVYLIDGDEMGIIIEPNSEGDIIEVTCQSIRLRDDEYDNPT